MWTPKTCLQLLALMLIEKIYQNTTPKVWLLTHIVRGTSPASTSKSNMAILSMDWVFATKATKEFDEGVFYCKCRSFFQCFKIFFHLSYSSDIWIKFCEGWFDLCWQFADYVTAAITRLIIHSLCMCHFCDFLSLWKLFFTPPAASPSKSSSASPYIFSPNFSFWKCFLSSRKAWT